MAILKIHPKTPQNRLIAQAAQLIKNGGVIAYPSDTTYALAADLFSKKAIERISTIKKLDSSKLFSCICYDFSKLSEYAFISNSHFRIMKHLLPGPYTFILKGKALLPKITLTRRKTIGIRMPDFPIVRSLYKAVDSPFLSCGTRLSDDEPLNDPQEIEDKLGHCIDLVIDGGKIPYAPSSIISLEEELPVILREGCGDLSFFRTE
ncbi:MAG: threonylcarbamoyl-AMP synthase [Elusimicrobia bacterium RIFOXYB2_FULL_49_7]|nr:MAG: threonylcarbamoyl-AMP synthase [Elusimicrobia bacterium RIFOXYB2_FULL_49_7]